MSSLSWDRLLKRLKYIGLALGIIAVDYVGFTVKADIQFFVISEITQTRASLFTSFFR